MAKGMSDRSRTGLLVVRDAAEVTSKLCERLLVGNYEPTTHEIDLLEKWLRRAGDEYRSIKERKDKGYI